MKSFHILYLSVCSKGVEISANQHELDDTSIFQLEYIGGKGFSCSESIAASTTILPQSPGGDYETQPQRFSATNGMAPGVYCLVTGHWRLRSRSGKLWCMASSTGVQNSASDGVSCYSFSHFITEDTRDSFCLWTAVPDGFIHLKPTNLRPDDDGNVSLDTGTEFLLHFLGNGRTLIRVVNDSLSGLNLVKAEPKGEVKWESTTEITINHIWEF
ncbi:hypothetical protein AHF37_12382 [Paragonimus kellicotti]|nr:hypothetical protein AHF37_12382 [Paragonimus kellicotti]